MNTLILLIRYAMGIAVIFMSIAFLFLSFWAGLVMFLAAVILLPPGGAWLAKWVPPLGRNQPAIATGVLLWFAVMLFGGSALREKAPSVATEPSIAPVGAATPNSPPSPQTATPAPAPPSAPAPAPAAAVDVSAKVNPDGAFLIEGDGWDKTRNQWGSTWIKRINKGMPLALRKAAESPECDYVELSGLSDRSVPKKSIEFYVDCRNQKRFYVSEADILAAGPVASKQSELAKISDQAAIESCERTVKSRLSYPLTFDRHYMDTSVGRATSGNIVVEFVFDAKNALGAELPQRARCVIDEDGAGPAEISNG